jgi:hypothetical protein
MVERSSQLGSYWQVTLEASGKRKADPAAETRDRIHCGRFCPKMLTNVYMNVGGIINHTLS